MSEVERDQTADEAPKATRRQRALLVDFCRIWQKRMSDAAPDATEAQPDAATPPVQGVPLPAMAPRLRQTLELLLAGDSEKQIAAKLKLSPHTIHGYVKAVYRLFQVCTRAELLALWVRKG